MKKILVCEDEESIRSFVVINLERAGYTVVQAGSGEEALSCYTADPQIDIALLDVMLPGIDGFETCSRLRAMSDTMGIVMLTARTQETEKVNGLQMGADDYVTKPFGTAELIARVDALYRRLETARRQSGGQPEIRLGEFLLDRRRRTLSRAGEPVDLTQLEYQIMEFFFLHPDRTHARADILHAIWGEGYFGDEKVVDVNVRRLRMKIEGDPSAPRHLLTVWGMGYRWAT